MIKTSRIIAFTLLASAVAGGAFAQSNAPSNSGAMTSGATTTKKDDHMAAGAMTSKSKMKSDHMSSGKKADHMTGGAMTTKKDDHMSSGAMTSSAKQ